MVLWYPQLRSTALKRQPMKRIALALALVLTTIGVHAQSTTPLPAASPNHSFGLKGDVIGESLEDFRARNHAVLSEEGYGPNDPKVDFVYPRCSGDVVVPPRPVSPDVNFNNGKQMAAYQRALTLYTSEDADWHNRYAGQTFLDKEAKDLGVDRICKLSPYTPPWGNATIAGAPGFLDYRFQGGPKSNRASRYDRGKI